VSVLLILLAVQLAALALILSSGGLVTSIAGVPVRMTSAPRVLINLGAAGVLLLVVSSDARQRFDRVARHVVPFSFVLMALAFWLSLGPVVRSHGRVVEGLGLYATFYEHVPGFGHLRVPARYALVGGVFLAIVAGAGAFTLIGLSKRRRAAVTAGLAAILLADAWFAPMPVNLTWREDAVVAGGRIEPASEAPAVYHVLAALPDPTVVAEFPFGDAAWDLRYVYYSTVHWKRLVNGYSGVFPQGAQRRVALLQRIGEFPDEAWRALGEADTTHVVVHEAAMTAAETATLGAWLTDHFAVEIARFESDVLYEMPGTFRIPERSPRVGR
jgi:hypothetical protein